MKFDLSKPVQTRDGRPARIVSEKGAGAFPIMAVVTGEDGTEHITRHTLAGSSTMAPSTDKNDLVNVPLPSRRETRFINLGHSYNTAESARKSASAAKWAILQLDLETGSDLTDVREVISAELVDA
jgi:hypothetical protein